LVSESAPLGVPIEIGRESVIVAFGLPYCLYLRDEVVTVRHAGRDIEVHLTKNWRELPEGGERVENAELQNDPTGRYRYSSARMAFTVADDEDPNDLAVSAINRLVDVYRFATGRAYLHTLALHNLDHVVVERPSTKHMEATFSFGGGGLGMAYPDDSDDVHRTVGEMLRNGDPVPLHSELFLTAERLGTAGYTRQAVIDCVSAVEVFVWGLLREKLIDKGRTSEYVDQLLQDEVLSDLMKAPMEEAIGWRPSSDNELWRSWIEANRIRRGATHHGASVSAGDYGSVLSTVRQLVAALEDHT
jgi:hypothetical protein